MSMALYSQVVSQVPQHFKSSETQATCDGCFSRQSVCSVISLHSGMSKAVLTCTRVSRRRWMLNIDTYQSGLPIATSVLFCKKPKFHPFSITTDLVLCPRINKILDTKQKFKNIIKSAYLYRNWLIWFDQRKTNSDFNIFQKN